MTGIWVHFDPPPNVHPTSAPASGVGVNPTASTSGGGVTYPYSNLYSSSNTGSWNAGSTTSDPKWNISDDAGTHYNVFVNQNVWSPGASDTQLTEVANLEQWRVTANFADTGSVKTYPSVGYWGGTGYAWSWDSKWSWWTSGWDVTIPVYADLKCGAAYDIWFDQTAAPGGPVYIPGSTTAINEVMIRFFSANWSNSSWWRTAVGPFGGFTDPLGHAIPSHIFNVWYANGTELVFDMVANAGDNNGLQIPVGSVDIWGMLQWLVTNGALAAGSTLIGLGLGVEILAANNRVLTFNDTWTYAG